jgi:hypothetical protein
MISKFLTFSPEKVIIFLSALVSLSLLGISAAFNVGDADSYLNFARKIVQFSGPTHAERTFGYPLLLILSTFTMTHSFVGILLVQAGMSVAITWFIYQICVFFSKSFAFIMSLLAIISLIPYNFQCVIFHDQAQLFFLLFLTYSLLAFTKHGTYKTAFMVLLVYSIMTCFRPTNTLLLPVILLNFYIILHKDKRRLDFLKLTIAMLTILLVVHLFTEAINWHFLHKQKSDRTITTVGIQIFDNVYRLSNRVPEAFSVGENTLQFKKVLLNHFANSENNFSDFAKIRDSFKEEDYQQYFAQYKQQPDKLVDALLKSPSDVHYWFLVSLFRIELGDSNADHVFLKTAIEQYKYHPAILFFIMQDGFYGYLFNNEPRHIQFYPSEWYKYSNEKMLVNTGFGKRFFTMPPLHSLFNMHDFSPYMVLLEKVWISSYHFVYRIISIGAVIGFCFSVVFLNTFFFRRKSSQEVFFLINIGLIYLSYIVPMLLLVDSRFRYQVGPLLLLFIMCGITFRKMILLCKPKSN